MKFQHKVSNNKSKFSFQQQLKQLQLENNQQQIKNTPIWDNLVVDTKTNARQKLKQYKKIMESELKSNDILLQQEFIKSTLTISILKEYLFGSTQSKAVLQNLVRKIDPTFQNLMQAASCDSIQSADDLKYWSQICDIIWQNNKKQHKQFQKQPAYVLQITKNIQQYFLQGVNIIKSNEFKSKWLQAFNQITRTLNLMVRMFKPILSKSQNKFSIIMDACRSGLTFSSSLSKQNVSQLYLLLLFLSPNQQIPTVLINKLHFYHAKSVITGQSNLGQLLQLLPFLKQSEHKCAIIPFLQKSFDLFFQTYPDKQNCFDQVINLFQVGRSIYSYLEGIIKTIISIGANWNMEGNFVRRFFVATIALKIVPTAKIIQLWPRVIEDVIIQSGNMNIPYAADCANILFQKFYEEVGQDQKQWSSIWLKIYLNKLESLDKASLRGIIEFINPILIRICDKPFLLKQLLAINNKQSNQNLQLGVISLIQCYKLIGKIQIKGQSKTFYHIDDPSIAFESNKIFQFLLSNEEMISIKALQLISLNHKPSQLIRSIQFQLLLEFYKNSTKTSMPQYRKNYLGVTKKLFQRLRTIYQSDLVEYKKKKSGNKMYFAQFKQFLIKLVDICFCNIFPDAIFQLVSSALEILQLTLTYFGTMKVEVKKGVVLEPVQILKQTQLFSLSNFQNIITCLQSSYQSVRKLSNQILNYFCHFQNKEVLAQLWKKSITNTNKLAIKNYEYACRVLNYISCIHSDILQLPTKYKSTQLNILQYFLNIMKQRFAVFKKQFVDQGQNYYQNLIHGILTIFSYSLDNLALQMKNKPQSFKEFLPQIYQFLDQFFNQIIQILVFSVQVSSSNISTVVLDTVSQSQTQKKLKVDCRGHFLLPQNQKVTNVGTYLESSALISSMQDDDEEGIQNNLVVSFYLLTRQAGLVFQSIGNLVSSQKQNSYVPKQSLIKLINTYFYALINLKHMGSVDRISNGLGKMAKVIFDHQSKQLSQMPQILLNKLLNHLKDGNFTNILRRSSGVPFAFCCLLKSQSAKHYKQVQKIVLQLLELSHQNPKTPIELRIHSLNILKKLFQDSDLKYDLDSFVSEAFISSIKGFTSEEWGIRNSSLMLFTVLSNRTVGVRPTYNLLQFFSKCPSLFDFIEKELSKIEEIKTIQTMYPPLYPIALLFSRILPFDVKQKSRLPVQTTNLKQIKKEQLLNLLPILDKSGLNNNYMGRVMTAKAILPFMQIDRIYQYCIHILVNLPLNENKDNNYLHYELTKCHHLLTSYNQICEDKHKQKHFSQQTLELICKFINNSIQIIQSIGCPSIQEGIFKIMNHFILNLHGELSKQLKDNYKKMIQGVIKICSNFIKKYLYQPTNMVIRGDLGHSNMRKEVVNLFMKVIGIHQQYFSVFKTQSLIFIHHLRSQFKNDQAYFKKADTQIIQYFFEFIIQNIRQANVDNNERKELLKQLSQILVDFTLDCIKSERVLIKLLMLRSIIKYKSISEAAELTYLQQVQKTTSNHFLQIAIFTYFVEINVEKQKIMNLLFKFSDPQSLQELRQCCLMFLNNQKQIDESLLVVYVRLLQDEQYQIRKQTAQIIAKLLGVYRFNQSYIKNKILQRVSTKDLQYMLKFNSDFQIKLKNYTQQKIFSFDKPNKFRSDISSLVYILTHNPKVIASDNIDEMINGKSQLKPQLISEYSNQILSRNQYLFQALIRMMVSNKKRTENIQQDIENISQKHTMFREVFKLYAK